MWRRPILGLVLLLVFSIGVLAEEKEAPPGTEPKPGELITNSIGMKLALIPAGEFVMGSTMAEVEKSVKAHGDSYRRIFDAEEPQHLVRITKPLYLGVYEVTQAEYERVMKENPSWFSKGGNGKGQVSGLDTSRFPVECVSWEESVEFCRRLGAMPEEGQAGRVYRLPTEAEWEYACRSGTTRRFNFGSRPNGREGNRRRAAPHGATEKGPSLRRSRTVGSYAPNASGLYDMHGNVWEWCGDWYERDHYKSSPLDDPQGPEKASLRVARGGSWGFPAGFCRPALRYGSVPAYRGYLLGFRVAADPPGD